MKDYCMYCHSPMNKDMDWFSLFQCSRPECTEICNKCQGLFQSYTFTEEQCENCGRPLLSTNQFDCVYDIHQKNYCLDCYRWKQKYPHQDLTNEAIYQYDDNLKEWLYRYKYLGDVRIANMVSNGLNHIYQKFYDFQWIILPSSPKNLIQRQFHPTQQLLQVAEIPCNELFIYIGDGKKQAQKNRQERMHQTQPFAVRKDCSILANKLLIFDDVYTTGTTIMNARKAIWSYVTENQLDCPEIKSLTLTRDIQNI